MGNKRRIGRPKPMGNVKIGVQANREYTFKLGGKIKTGAKKIKK